MCLRKKIKNVSDIVKWRLCLGCGACVAVCPETAIKLVDKISDGLRPEYDNDKCKKCGNCISVCPGVNTCKENNLISKLDSENFEWGRVLEIWEGYATDKKIRHAGSSGGVVTAIAQYCLENDEFNGVVHTVPSLVDPIKNEITITKDKDSLLQGTGSRYSPSGVCRALTETNLKTGKYVFVGKGCDITGFRNICKLTPSCKEKIGLSIGIFCAGTPSTDGTFALLKSMGISPEQLKSIRYRGNGWPGLATAKTEKLERKLTYKESWGVLQKFRPFRCYLCVDGTSEQADISCGDAWYRINENESDGISLILIRTDEGQKVIHDAIKKGYITAKKVSIESLQKSQDNLLEKRRNVFGRIIALKMFAIPYPLYKWYFLKKSWRKLSFNKKVKSILSTIKRIIQRRYFFS